MTAFRTGIVFPQTEIGDDRISIRDFAQAAEELGFAFIVAYDHVIGADISNRPGWAMPYTAETSFHEPLTLFSYLSGVTEQLGFTTGVMIAPQRQTVLMAKQAANLDVYSGGRLRLGVGLGWNEVEYEALGADFRSRVRRLDEQIGVLRRLWTEKSVTLESAFHRITEAGIKPLPIQQPIPILVGGSSAPAMKRAARLGDGWIPVFPRPAETTTADDAKRIMAAFHAEVHAAGRDPATVTVDNGIFLGTTVGGPLRTVKDALIDRTS